MGKVELIAVVVLIIVVLFVGAKKLPELARGIGQAGKELKNGFKSDPVEPEKVSKSTTSKKA